MNKSYISIDVETTGLNPYLDRIIEIGAVAFDETGKQLGHYQSLVNPGRSLSQKIVQITSLTDDQLKDAPRFEEVVGGFFAFLNSYESPTLLAHNAKFDINFINGELWKLAQPLDVTHDVHCTLAMARVVYPGFRNYSLISLVAFAGLPWGDFHRSLADCIHCGNLFFRIVFRKPDINIDNYKSNGITGKSPFAIQKI